MDLAFNPTASNSPRFRSAWSPSTSMVSASPSASPSPSRSTFSDESGAESDQAAKRPEEPDYLSDDVDDEDTEKRDLSTSEKKEKMGPYLLEVIDWFTHHSENHVWLLKKGVIETLVTVVSSLPNSAVERAGRAIKRLVRSHECLPHLLNMKLHLVVVKNLIRRPCLLTRYAQRCPRCEDKRQFGREVVQELSLQANSVSGWSFLENLLKSPDEEVKFFAVSTGVTLIREITYRNKLYQQFDALNVLFSVVEKILEEADNCVVEFLELNDQEEVDGGEVKDDGKVESIINKNPEDPELKNQEAMDNLTINMAGKRLESNEQEPTDDSNESPTRKVSDSSQSKTEEEINNMRIDILNKYSEKLEAVFFSVASLVSHKMMYDILESQGEFQEAFQAMISRPCQMKEPPEDKKLIFKNRDGKILSTVDVENLCKSSEYYRGMFENPFLESTKGKKEFVVDEETIEIKDEHFVKFLHLLSGCRDSRCVAIESTSTCVALVYVSLLKQ